MENRFISIKAGPPMPNLLLVVLLSNFEMGEIPYRLAFFNDGKFMLIGGGYNESPFVEKHSVEGYRYILDKEGKRVDAF